MQDHSEAAMNAKLRSWIDIIVNNCYPHAARMVCRATRSRLLVADNGPKIRRHFRSSQGLTILEVFQHAMMLFYAFWIVTEPNFIEWFKETYDKDGRWLGWFAGTPRVL